jgi:Icc-related predicted phosphoesterase
MARQRVTRVLCAAEPGGAPDAVEALLGTAEESDVQAIALVGDLGGDSGADGLRALFKTLARSDLPAFWVPGPGDAPVADYLREAANIEIVAPFLRGLHGTAAFADGHVLFAGFGGEVSDDPAAPRDETERLSYPRWEPEYRLKLVRELDEHQLVLMFWTPPAHKGQDSAGGADVVAELIGTYRPRLVITGGEQRTELIGRSLVVAPGRLADGHYAIADLHEHAADVKELATAGARGS